MNSRRPVGRCCFVLPFVTLVLGGLLQADLSHCWGQQVGQRVVVMADFETKVRSRKVGKIYGGTIRTITHVEDKWCMVEGTQGWLPLQYTMSLDSASKVYQKRIAANEQDYDAVSVLGMIQYEKGDVNGALTQLTKALNLNNRVATIWNNRAIVLSGANRLEEALRDINTALQLNPKYAGAYGNRGLIHVGRGDFQQAIEDFGKAIELEPGNPVHFKNRGAAYQSMREREQALADFNRAIQADRGYAKAYIGRANVYLSQGDLNNAYLNAEEAVRLDSTSAVAWNNLGWVQYRRGMLDKAVQYFTKAVELDGEMAIAFSNRGVVFTDQSEFDSALRDFNRALRIESGSAICHNNRANAWIGKKDYRQALTDFEKAVELAPNLPDALNGFAWFLATCPEDRYRDGERALTLVDRALEIEREENWNLQDTKAAVLAELGRFDEAVELQGKALATVDGSSRGDFEERLSLYQSEKPFRATSGKFQRDRD